MWQQMQQRWSELEPGKRKLIIILAGATVLTAMASFAILKSRGAMSPLYAGLPATETREIAAELSRQGIDYTTSADETSIMVPSRLEHRARMLLASAGLPRSSPEKGWEIFGEGGLAVTKPQQQAMQIRALQGELSRSIASLENVSKAAVHISLKQDSPFLAEQQPAKAAVLLHLKPGKSISREQAMAIAHLVAKSVPDLETAQITIVDEKGALLFSDNVARGNGETDFQRQVEKEIERRVQSQLDMTFGMGKAIVRCSAITKLDRSEVRKTTYTPVVGGRDGIASKEGVETEEFTGGPGGRVGGAPGTGANIFNQNLNGQGNQQGAGNYKRSKQDREYKINEEQELLIKPGGGVQRLTLGIFVDEALKDSLPKIETVARNAAGVDEKRGDSISVESVKFLGSNVDSFNTTTRMEMIKTIARLILNGLALVIGLLTLRSIVAALKPQPVVHEVPAPEDLEEIFAEDDAPKLGEETDAEMPLLTSAADEDVAAGAEVAVEGEAPAEEGGGGPGLTSKAQAGGGGGGGGLTGRGGSGLTGHGGPGLSGLTGPGLSGMRESRLFQADDTLDPDFEPELTGPTPEEMIGRVQNTQIDDITEVLRHWLEGELDEE